VQLRAEVRDAAFTPLADLTLAASAGGTPLSLKPVPNQPGVYAAEFRPESAGTLLIEASAQRGARALGTAHAVVHFEPDAEFFSVRQNRALLEQLAQATGARYWPTDALAGLPAAIRASSAGVMQQEILPLWDAPAVFLLLLLLKCGEWLLRRRWGAV
jgi:hypothetical protein